MLHKIGECYKSNIQTPIYKDPWIIGSDQSDEIVSDLLENDIFLLLDVVSCGVTRKNLNHLTENFKILINSKIGWITLSQNNIPKVFNKLEK